MVLRVAICGGGIGGLSLALILKNFQASQPLTIDVYEAESTFSSVGAGITLWQRTRSIFAALGLQLVLENRALSPPLMLRKSDTKEPFTFDELPVPYGSIALPRAEMVQLLVECLEPNSTPGLAIHFAKRLSSYQQDGDGVTLHFADGSSASADLLVGADGIGSAARRTMYADIAERTSRSDPEKAAAVLESARPTWSGTYAYRTLLPRERLQAVSPNNVMLGEAMIWCGSGKHVISYPISPTIINILFYDTIPGGLGQPLSGPPVVSATKEEIVELYQDWEDDLCIAAENIGEVSKWAISHIRNLPQYADGRVVLLGDSAHAMSTHFGAGAGQAIDDSYILGRILTHPGVTTANLVDALKVYDAVRRPIADDITERSLRTGFLYELHPDYVPAGTDLDKLRAGDPAELRRITDEARRMSRFHWAEMPEQDWERARALLERQILGKEDGSTLPRPEL
ncbi:FAD/NAD-binding domain-containing protein [Phanerochaete sordida]|uniref:FAD/NAD-binding domain-containing protein n=1 Tax=Phanerochaete sordida TaxID=48140 RepID=A0A9P3LGE4_9APHY|nr:FAD/NAD-binding domain-containing protein [Phanerochaete sordida]